MFTITFTFQILAIDGQPLDSQISHQQAIGILQKAKGAVDLVVASSHQDDANFKAAALEASSAAAQAERDSASIGSDWCQVNLALLLIKYVFMSQKGEQVRVLGGHE